VGSSPCSSSVSCRCSVRNPIALTISSFRHMTHLHLANPNHYFPRGDNHAKKHERSCYMFGMKYSLFLMHFTR
jgi:hypothetical protein